MSSTDPIDEAVEHVTQELLGLLRQRTDKPVALEALWDFDTQFCYLDLCVVVRDLGAPFGPPYRSIELTGLSYGRDLRVINRSVPPWPEALVAQRAGRAVADQLGIPFWFPCPDLPGEDAPHWWEQDQATPCEDCAKPILRRQPSQLPKELCHHCWAERERVESLRKGAPRKTYRRGVYCVPLRGSKQVGPAFFFSKDHGARELLEITAELSRPIEIHHELILEPAAAKALKALVLQRVEALFARYRWPHERYPEMMWMEKILSNTLLLSRMKLEHLQLSWWNALYRALEPCTGAEVLRFFTNAGIGPREFQVLDALRRQEGGEMTLASLSKRLSFLGEPADVLEVVRDLEELGCVSTPSDSVRLTLKGRITETTEG